VIRRQTTVRRNGPPFPLARVDGEDIIGGMRAVKLPGLEGHDWIDAKEVARVLGVEPVYVRVLVHRKHLRPVKFGNSSVFDSRDIEKYASRRRRVGRPAKKSRKGA